jgi:two-component system, sensor histidine kinase
VQRLARLLDSPVTLRSQPGRGSMFAIAVPRAQAVAPPREAAAPAGDGNSLAGKLIVVVDDEPVVLDATRVLLASWGCEVVAAESGAQVRECLATSTRAPDVLVCDYRLRAPENGLLVVEALREEFNRQIPAVIVSGDVLPESIEIESSCDITLLHKPVPELVLHATLARLAGSA